MLITEPEKVERAKGIEPSSSAWEADALPLCYARISLHEAKSQELCSALNHYATFKGHGKWIWFCFLATALSSHANPQTTDPDRLPGVTLISTIKSDAICSSAD